MKKRFLLIPGMSLLLFLTGCWDRYELEERANILGLAVDLAEDDEVKSVPKVTHLEGDFPKSRRDSLYKVTAQLAVPGKIKLGPEGGGGEGSEKTAWILETYGHTMKDAMANLQQQLAEKLYLGHLQIVVVSEDVAKKGLTDVNDFLRRDHEVRRTAWLAVNEKTAADVLKTAPPLETVPALYLSDTLDNAVRFGKLPREYLGKFWIDISDMGVDGILPAVKVIDGDRIMVDGLAFFEGKQMVGQMSPIEIGAYMTMKEKNPGGYSLAVAYEDGEGAYMIKPTERKSKVKLDFNKGKPTAKIIMELDAILEEEVNDASLNIESIKKIEKAAGEKLTEICEGLLHKLQVKGSDLIGIGARVRAKYGTYWDKEIKNDEKWTEVYKDMDIDVRVTYNIRRTGMEWN